MDTPYRSGFESRLAEKLHSEGVDFVYEDYTYPIELSVVGHKCLECGSKKIGRSSVFTPDFFFKNWVIEAKGKFTARDRKRVLALLETPSLKGHFGMLFMRDNKLSKNSPTRYSTWCEKNGIPYAFGWFKKEWLK